jgi:tRNA-dihydrouridine synthase
MKKQLGQYIKSIPNAAQWRSTLLRTQTPQEMIDALNLLKKELGIHEHAC